MSRQLVVWLGSKAISYSNFENILQAQTLYNLREIKVKWNRMFPCYFLSELLIIGRFDGPSLKCRADHSFSHFFRIPKIKSKSIGFRFVSFQNAASANEVTIDSNLSPRCMLQFNLLCNLVIVFLHRSITKFQAVHSEAIKGKLATNHFMLIFCYLKKNPWISMKSYCKPKKRRKQYRANHSCFRGGWWKKFESFFVLFLELSCNWSQLNIDHFWLSVSPFSFNCSLLILIRRSKRK